MAGYWNLPEQSERAYLVEDREMRWYRTGDIVQRQADGDYIFRGRRDRMIKKRGYRVELGEIEATLYRHPEVKETAVVAQDREEGVHVRACIVTRNGERLSIIALKKFCVEQLPLYMTPDSFEFFSELPKTSTDKIDYQELAKRVTESR